jgi:hypothetical protein
MDLVLASRFQRQFVDKSSEVENGKICPFETRVHPDDNGDACLLSLDGYELVSFRVYLLESGLVGFIATILRISPINSVVVNLSRSSPNSLVARAFCELTDARTSLSLGVSETIRTVSAETVEANIIWDSQSLIRTHGRLGEILRNATVCENIGGRNRILTVKIAESEVRV